ncbi:hypothetical protein GCM10027284_38270 [Cyclobacterium sediminis]
MKNQIIYIFAILVGFAIFSCSQEEETELDTRLLVNQPIDPSSQPDELNKELIINGELQGGNMPSAKNPDQIRINIFVSSALITNDNYLFLPFSFDSNEQLKGIYIEVEGAQGHWDAPANLDPDENSFAVAIGIPNYIQKGDFVVSYRIYDQNNNVSEKKSINVSIVDSENRCGSGQSFPRVSGSDGITVKTYDMGDFPGIVNISYYMYTRKDRMDIRYNGEWVASTGPDLLESGKAPPYKLCNEATAADGFVSGGGSFSIPYDPAISREISIYVSGCLQGGTAWYFDVSCPSSGGNNPNPPANIICDNGQLLDTYDPSHENYHIYPKEGEELNTVICDTSVDPTCNARSVFNAMLEQSNFIAPTPDTSPVEDCKLTWVEILTPTNPIISKINYFDNSVTNYTMANQVDKFGIERSHLLHPGKVTRKVELIDGKVVVSTKGEGTGWAASINTFFSEIVWKKVDDNLKEYWDK